ncbi:9640_t:CDS:2 [Entrophospora sp. SA101]|nr:9640_t:CDS:2 [Entrophospora sp. SA101]
MNFPDDFHDLKLCGKPKGIKLILEERELWPKEGLRLTCTNKNIEANTSLIKQDKKNLRFP